MTQSEALKTAILHLEHMAAWIGRQNAGYSFESLGEDMPGIKAALEAEPTRKQLEDEHAALIVDHYRCAIGRLMQQAQHWHEEGKHPLAVHHRVMKADSYYQIVALFGRDGNRATGFEQIRHALNMPITRKDLGTYPPSPELHVYRDVAYVAKLLAGTP